MLFFAHNNTGSVCFSESWCETIHTGAPSPPAPTTTLSGGSMESFDCTINPSFCKFNRAYFNECDGAMLMSQGSYTYTDGKKAVFNGINIVNSTIKTLAQLGMSNADKVVVTGIYHGGLAALLHADRIKDLLVKYSPKHTVYKVIPADSIMPDLPSVLFPGAHVVTGIFETVQKITGLAHNAYQECTTGKTTDTD